MINTAYNFILLSFYKVYSNRSFWTESAIVDQIGHIWTKTDILDRIVFWSELALIGSTRSFWTESALLDQIGHIWTKLAILDRIGYFGPDQP